MRVKVLIFSLKVCLRKLKYLIKNDVFLCFVFTFLLWSKIFIYLLTYLHPPTAIFTELLKVLAALSDS